MALPANVSTGTVTGTWIDPDGNPMTGQVVFTPSAPWLLDATASPNPVTIMSEPVAVRLVNGAISKTLIATNDADLNPTGWTWECRREFDGVSPTSFSFTLSASETKDLTTASSVAASNGDASFPDLTSINTSLAAKVSRVLSVRTVSGTTYTLVAADEADEVIETTSASATTITVPQDSAATISQNVPLIWRQYGAGQITFAQGTGATLISRGNVFKSAGQYAEGTITKVRANTWLLSGDITA